MDDSIINPILLSSSIHLENVEQLIKNLEKQTVNLDNFDNILNNNHRQDIVTKSFTSNKIPINDVSDENFLIKSITFTNSTISNDHKNENLSIDSLLTQDYLSDNNEFKKQQILLNNNQSLLTEHDDEFTWDDQYDTRNDYRLTFSTDKLQKIDSKLEKYHRYKHRLNSQKTSLTSSNDDILSNVDNNMNDWSIRSSFNTFENPQLNSILSQQQISNNNSSPSSSSSTSWRQMKENRQITTEIPTKDTRSPSPLSLYKIFQKKSNINSSIIRSTFHLSQQQQNNTIIPNYTNELTTEKLKSSQSQPNIDQAIQTSIILDSSSNTQYRTTSNDHLNRVLPKSESHNPFIVSNSIHKSLPDLSFISKYSKSFPRSHTASPLPVTSSSSNNIARTTPSPTLIQQQKQDSDRPRTLKSIKRYKNSKHSTEPLGVFYSPQLRKTFAALPATTINIGSNTSPTIIKMKLPSSFSSQQEEQKLLNLKSCLKYRSRANSYDIQSTLQNRKLSVPSLIIPEPENDKDSISSSLKYHYTEVGRVQLADITPSSNILRAINSSNNLNSYISQDLSREYHSEYDLTLINPQQNQTKKSVSFSENISQHLLSPCNPTITFNNNLSLALHENKERLSKKTTKQYGEMRRCQTDIIVVDPVLHLHSFTDSPPNEFHLQPDKDDEILTENIHINIIPSSPIHQTESISIEKDNNLSDKTLISMNTSTFDDILEKINNIIKQLFEIKRSEKSFFLNNEQNLQLDSLLKNDLCNVIQNIFEHGRKDFKKITLWKIIETSIEQNTSTLEQIPQVYYDAIQIAQNISSYWLYKFQAFIFALLNKNELINWLYFFTRQKDIIQRYYQSPDALILLSISSTFNLFERIMTQLEKLTSFTFRLTYHIPNNNNNSSINNDQLNTSMISTYSTKTNARDWIMTISRRTSKNLTQPIIQTNSNDTFRSTLSRKFNGFFTKTNLTQPKKTSSVVTTKLPEPRQSTKSPGLLRRPRLSNVFNNSTATVSTNKTIIVPSPKLNNSIGRDVSLSPSSNRVITTFQSKIPRPSLNVDKSKSVRYRSTTTPSK